MWCGVFLTGGAFYIFPLLDVAQVHVLAFGDACVASNVLGATHTSANPGGHQQRDERELTVMFGELTEELKNTNNEGAETLATTAREAEEAAASPSSKPPPPLVELPSRVSLSVEPPPRTEDGEALGQGCALH